MSSPEAKPPFEQFTLPRSLEGTHLMDTVLTTAGELPAQRSPNIRHTQVTGIDMTGSIPEDLCWVLGTDYRNLSFTSTTRVQPGTIPSAHIEMTLHGNQPHQQILLSSVDEDSRIVFPLARVFTVTPLDPSFEHTDTQSTSTINMGDVIDLLEATLPNFPDLKSQFTLPPGASPAELEDMLRSPSDAAPDPSSAPDISFSGLTSIIAAELRQPGRANDKGTRQVTETYTSHPDSPDGAAASLSSLKVDKVLWHMLRMADNHDFGGHKVHQTFTFEVFCENTKKQRHRTVMTLASPTMSRAEFGQLVAAAKVWASIERLGEQALSLIDQAGWQ